MPIITIYQGASGEGQELAETVAEALGYRCVGREVLVEASRRGHTQSKTQRDRRERPALVGASAARSAALPNRSSSYTL